MSEVEPETSMDRFFSRTPTVGFPLRRCRSVDLECTNASNEAFKSLTKRRGRPSKLENSQIRPFHIPIKIERVPGWSINDTGLNSSMPESMDVRFSDPSYSFKRGRGRPPMNPALREIRRSQSVHSSFIQHSGTGRRGRPPKYRNGSHDLDSRFDPTQLANGRSPALENESQPPESADLMLAAKSHSQADVGSLFQRVEQPDLTGSPGLADRLDLLPTLDSGTQPITTTKGGLFDDPAAAANSNVTTSALQQLFSPTLMPRKRGRPSTKLQLHGLHDDSQPVVKRGRGRPPNYMTSAERQRLLQARAALYSSGEATSRPAPPTRAPLLDDSNSDRDLQAGLEALETVARSTGDQPDSGGGIVDAGQSEEDLLSPSSGSRPRGRPRGSGRPLGSFRGRGRPARRGTGAFRGAVRRGRPPLLRVSDLENMGDEEDDDEEQDDGYLDQHDMDFVYKPVNEKPATNNTTAVPMSPRKPRQSRGRPPLKSRDYYVPGAAKPKYGFDIDEEGRALRPSDGGYEPDIFGEDDYNEDEDEDFCVAGDEEEDMEEEEEEDMEERGHSSDSTVDSADLGVVKKKPRFKPAKPAAAARRNHQELRGLSDEMVPRKRGRPRLSTTLDQSNIHAQSEVREKRPRGRPPSSGRANDEAMMMSMVDSTLNCALPAASAPLHPEIPAEVAGNSCPIGELASIDLLEA